MNLLHLFLLCLIVALYLHDVLSYPTQFPDDNLNDQLEDRHRKHKRRRRPCTRQDTDASRWFLGHDVTLFLGDVTIHPGNNPCHSNAAESQPNKPLLGDSHIHRPGIFAGQKPGLLNNNRPLFGNRPNHQGPVKPSYENKPVHEVIDEDEEPEQYRPGSLVGAPSGQINGHGQDLTNFSPSRIFSRISRHFNSIVDPFIDLFV